MSLAILTSINITGTSTSTPTTVANAAPDCRPKREIATATANSKKLLAPIIPAEVILTPSVGFTPWKGYYHDKTAFTDISLKASKSIGVSKKISMPLFVQAIASPINDHVYLVAGIGLGFWQ